MFLIIGRIETHPQFGLLGNIELRQPNELRTTTKAQAKKKVIIENASEYDCMTLTIYNISTA
jgi:hypothetical protein